MTNMIKNLATCHLLGMITVVCLFLTNLQAQPLQGKWKVEKIIYEKEVENKNETITYNSIAEVKDRIRFPKEINVKDKQNIILHYPNSNEDIIAEYIIENEHIIITSVGVILQYQYNINNGLLSLTTKQNYKNRTPEGVIEDITEKWTLILIKQTQAVKE